jgi:hypothetical protein
MEGQFGCVIARQPAFGKGTLALLFWQWTLLVRNFPARKYFGDNDRCLRSEVPIFFGAAQAEGVVIPELLKDFFKQVSADGLQLVVEEIAQRGGSVQIFLFAL